MNHCEVGDYVREVALKFPGGKEGKQYFKNRTAFISPCSHTHPRTERAFLSQKLAVRGRGIGHLGRAQGTCNPRGTFVQISGRSPFWVDAEGEQGVGWCSDLLAP